MLYEQVYNQYACVETVDYFRNRVYASRHIGFTSQLTSRKLAACFKVAKSFCCLVEGKTYGPLEMDSQW